MKRIKYCLGWPLFFLLLTGCMGPKNVARTKASVVAFNESLLGTCEHRMTAEPLDRQCTEWRGPLSLAAESESQCVGEWGGTLKDQPCSRELLLGTCILHSKSRTTLFYYYDDDWLSPEAEAHCLGKGYELHHIEFTVYWAPDQR